MITTARMPTKPPPDRPQPTRIPVRSHTHPQVRIILRPPAAQPARLSPIPADADQRIRLLIECKSVRLTACRYKFQKAGRSEGCSNRNHGTPFREFCSNGVLSERRCLFTTPTTTSVKIIKLSAMYGHHLSS